MNNSKIFGSLNFSVSGDFLDKNRKFFEELEKNPQVVYYSDESEGERGTYFDLIEVNFSDDIPNAIPVPIFFEISGMEWDEELSIDKVISSVRDKNIKIVAVIDRAGWDAAQRHHRQEAEAKRWTRIDCKKNCRAVDPFYNDLFFRGAGKNNHCCPGGIFWLVSKEFSRSSEHDNYRDYVSGILDPEGENIWWACNVPEKDKADAKVKEVQPGDSWICPRRREWYAKNRVPNVVIPLPGGYAQINDGNGLPKAVISPEGQLTANATLDILVLRPEYDSTGIIYCAGSQMGRNLFEKFIMLAWVCITDNDIPYQHHYCQHHYRNTSYIHKIETGSTAEGEVNWLFDYQQWNNRFPSFIKPSLIVKRSWLSQEIGGQESDRFKKLSHLIGLD
ncbi:MAG: hypothetical protein V1770_04630 [bacterium]